MKKILTALFLIISVVGFSQNVTVRTNGISTVEDVRLMAGQNLILPRFLDTTNANTNRGLDSSAAIIFTYNNNAIWYRASNPKRWLMIGSGVITDDSIYVKPPLYVYVDSLGRRVIAIQMQDGLVSGGIVTWSGQGLIFNISPAVYVIGGNYYSSPATSDTLSPADPDNPRYDLFVVDTSNRAGHITGEAAPSPTVPQPEIGYQLALTNGLIINPGDTVPSGVPQPRIIYDETAVSPEWTISTVGNITLDSLNTDNPYHLTHDIFVSKYNNIGRNPVISWTDFSIDTFHTNDVLQFAFYTNGRMNNPVYFDLLKSGSYATKYLILNSAGTPYINSNDSNNYVQVTIPLNNLTWLNDGTYNSIRLGFLGTDSSGAKGLYLDYIRLQSGIPNIPPANDYSNKLDSVTTVKLTDSTYINLNWIKGLSYQKGDTIKTSSSSGGTPQRFGIEDNTGIQDRSVDMGEFNLNVQNAPSIGFSSNSSLDTTSSITYNKSQLLLSKSVTSTGVTSSLAMDGDATYLSQTDNVNDRNVYFSLLPNGHVDLTSYNTGNSSDFYLTPTELGIIAPNIYLEKTGSSSGAGYVLTDVAGDGYASWQPVSGGGGSTNTSVGSGFKVAINGTNNIKSLTAGYSFLLDSITTNQINLKVDSAALSLKYLRIADSTTAYTTPYQSSLKVSKVIADATYATITNLALKVNISDTANMLGHYFKDFNVNTDTTVVFIFGNNTTKTLTITGGGTILNGTGYVKMSGTTPSYQTPTQVTADLDIFTSSLKGLVPASGGLSSKVLHGDGVWRDTTAVTASAGWNSTGGNAGTNDTLTYLGTNNFTNLIFKTNATRRVKIDSVGTFSVTASKVNGLDSGGIYISPNLGASPYIRFLNSVPTATNDYISTRGATFHTFQFGSTIGGTDAGINAGYVNTIGTSNSSSFNNTGAQIFAIGGGSDVFLSLQHYGVSSLGGFGAASGSSDFTFRNGGASSISNGTQFMRVFGSTQNVMIGTPTSDITSSLFTVNTQTNSTLTYKVSIPTPKVTSGQRDSIISGVLTGTIVGGSAYTPGTYTNVALTGGTGAGAHANITVSAGGVVTTLNLTDAGGYYSVGDVLSATIAGGSGFTYTIATITSTVSAAQIYNTSTNSLNIYNGINWTGDFVSSAASTLTLKFGNDYIFTGSTSTYTLPALSASIAGRRNMITIKNAGSGSITLNSIAGGNDIYNTSAVATLTITAGSAVRLMPNGTAFYVE